MQIVFEVAPDENASNEPLCYIFILFFVRFLLGEQQRRHLEAINRRSSHIDGQVNMGVMLSPSEFNVRAVVARHKQNKKSSTKN